MSKSSGKAEAEKVIATNPIAYSNFFINEVYEAGLSLTGTEIKSIRSVAPNLRDAFVEVQKEAWLVNMHIGPYSHGNIWNHEPRRRRKLLLHKHQIEKLFGEATRGGMTIIPTRMYFVKGRVKVEIGVGKGKKKFDKREDLKSRSAEREMDQARKRNQRDE